MVFLWFAVVMRLLPAAAPVSIISSVPLQEEHLPGVGTRHFVESAQSIASYKKRLLNWGPAANPSPILSHKRANKSLFHIVCVDVASVWQPAHMLPAPRFYAVCNSERLRVGRRSGRPESNDGRCSMDYQFIIFSGLVGTLCYPKIKNVVGNAT